MSWWVSLLRKHQVKHLVMVADPGPLIIQNAKGTTDLVVLLRDAGYRLVRQEPKYSDRGLQDFGPFPAEQYLFSL